MKTLTFEELENLSIQNPLNENYKRVINFICRMFTTREYMIETVNKYRQIKQDTNGKVFYSECTSVEISEKSLSILVKNDI